MTGVDVPTKQHWTLQGVFLGADERLFGGF